MHRGGRRHPAARCTAPGRDLVGATKMCPGKTCPRRGEQLEKKPAHSWGPGVRRNFTPDNLRSQTRGKGESRMGGIV